MKNIHLKKINKVYLLIFLISIPITAYFFFGFSLLHRNDIFIRNIIKQRQTWIQEHNDTIQVVITDIFPLAESCYLFQQEHKEIAFTRICEEEIRSKIDTNLSTILRSKNDSVGRKPLYFIQLKDNETIQKIFQSGHYIETKATTKELRMVVEMLQGKRDPFAYPQYSCCGGDDYVPSLPILKTFLPVRLYLKDFYTETEQIFLIRDKDNTILGALVYLYGD